MNESEMVDVFIGELELSDLRWISFFAPADASSSTFAVLMHLLEREYKVTAWIGRTEVEVQELVDAMTATVVVQPIATTVTRWAIRSQLYRRTVHVADLKRLDFNVSLGPAEFRIWRQGSVARGQDFHSHEGLTLSGVQATVRSDCSLHVDTSESGWEIVCPDGRVRGYPFINEDDARAEASEKTQQQCRLWPEPSTLELEQPPCPGGEHVVRSISFRNEAS